MMVRTIFKRLNLLIVIVFFNFCTAQNFDRKFIDATLMDNMLQVEVNDGYYTFKFYQKNIIETTFIPNSQNQNPDSHAVVMQPKFVETAFVENENKLSFGSENLTVEVIYNPFQIKYLKHGKLLISEKLGYFRSQHFPMETVKGNIISDFSDKIEFNLTQEEILYGGGARAMDMNRRGNRLPLFNRAHYGYETQSDLMNYTMPIVISSKKYLIHFDNAATGYLDLDSQHNNTLTYEAISGRKTYQIVVGENWSDLIENYTELTGKQPMLPRWALGNFSSRFGYHSQAETNNTIQKFRNEKIPVDAVILDLYWFGKEIFGTMGNLEFDKDSFPNPTKMIQDLKRKSVETVLITEPFILNTSNRWQEAIHEDILAKDSIGNPYVAEFYFGNTGLIDIYSHKGYNWFKNIYKSLLDKGVTGMWGDLGEPEVHPYNMIHATGSAQDVHNIYGHDWARLVQEAYFQFQPKLRPFILMRAGYSGTQRYGIVPWSGDVKRSWGGLQSQPKISLQMGLQGLAYMHSDLGGFAGDNLDDELYVRWLQYGVFQPIYRPHAQEEVPSEPVFRSDWAKNLAHKAIELRYKLLPYNYNLVYENSIRGMPLMRPLFFIDDNPELAKYTDAYLWGKDFLISPVLAPGIEQQEIYFPKNSDWIDFYSGEIHKGGSTESVKLEENYIPTFVRSGSIIPFAEPMQSTKEYDGNNLIFNYYFDEKNPNSTLNLFNDDGLSSNSIENNAFEILNVHTQLIESDIAFNLKANIGSNYKPSEKKIQLYIYNLHQIPKSVQIGKNKYPIHWKKNSKILKLEFEWNTLKEKVIKLNF